MSGVVAVVCSTGTNLRVIPPFAYGVGAATTVTTYEVQALAQPPGSTTYDWVYVSGDISLVPLLPTTGNSGVQQWQSFGLAPGEVRQAFWRVSATRSGQPFGSAEVPVSVERL